MKKIKFDLWKILEWGSWFLVNIISFIASSMLFGLTGNGFVWVFGFSILLLMLLYGEAMRRKGEVDE